MKIHRSLTEIVIIVGFFIWIGSAGPVIGAPSDPAAAGTAKVLETETGYLENITFEKLKGKERVILMLSRRFSATAEDQGSRSVMIKVDNLFVPQDLRRVMGEGVLDNLIRVTPNQQTAGGKPQAVIGIELQQWAPYSVRQNGHQTIIDFNVASLPARPAGPATGDKPALPESGAVKAAAPVQTPTYAGRLVSLELQDANIKSVLHLLAEESGVNIVSGDDVKGNITVQMKKVPWEQALDTILGITGLVKKQQGNMITVMTMKRLRDDEKSLESADKERYDAELARISRENDRRKKEPKQQISIEAKIIEATDDFVRKVGVQWGTGFTDKLGGGNPYGLLAGSSPIGSTSSSPFGFTRGLAGSGLALSTSSLAANFPMSTAAPSFALGMAIGGANAILDAEILAAETNSDVRIISSPKVTTMDGEKAIIKQGEDVPIVTPGTATSPPTVSFKEAVLKLEVKPTIPRDKDGIIIKDGKISMEVTASNDYADYARAVSLGVTNPPINKSQVEAKVEVSDGETLVIGGILKATTQKADQGLPWISKVPILGWLFKYESVQKQRKQLLIFITPRLIKAEATAPKMENREKQEKPKG